MRAGVVAGIVIAVLASDAKAADMAVKAPSKPASADYDWTGFLTGNGTYTRAVF